MRQGRVVSFGLAGAFLGSLGGASSHTMHVHKPHAAHSPHTSLTATRATPQAGRSPTASAARAASRTRRRPAPSARPCAPARAPSLRCCLAASSAAWASAPRSAACPSSSRRWRRHHSAASSPLSTRCLACLPAHPSACPPAYVSPSASPRLCLPQLFTCSGILLSIVAGLPLARAGPAYWRKMFAVAVLPCIAQLGALLAVPESPRWLAQAGRAASNRKPNPKPNPKPNIRTRALAPAPSLPRPGGAHGRGPGGGDTPVGAGRERAASGDERYGGRQLGAAGEPALPPARGHLEPALRLPAVRRHQCRRLLLYQGARHAHGEHAARGTHSEGHTHSPCSAPAAHIAHAAQSCLPRDQCLPPAAGLCKRGRRLGGGRLHPRRRVQHRWHRVRRTAPGQARAPSLPLFPTLTTPAALATPATAATFTSPAPFTTPAAAVTPTTPLIPNSRQHSSYLS